MSEKTPPRKTGRPTKYKKEYCESLIKIMSRGYSYEAFAGHIKVHVDTLYEWEKKHELFSEAKTIAFGANRYYWETIGISGAAGSGQINAAVWIFNMKNRFGWRDRRDVNHESKDGSMTPKEFKVEIVK